MREVPIPVLLFPGNFDRAMCFTCNAFANGSKHRALEPGHAAGADDDEVGVDGLGDGEDLFDGLADTRMHREADRLVRFGMDERHDRFAHA